MLTFEEIMAYSAPNNERVFIDLKNKYNSAKNTNVVPFVGAGLSHFSEKVYPLWNQVLTSINKVLGHTKRETINSLLQSSEENKYIKAADMLSDGQEFSFYEYLYDIFKVDLLERISFDNKAVNLLPLLFPNSLLITTNIDQTIETVYSNNQKHIQECYFKDYTALERIIQNNTNSLLYKVHGDINSNYDNIIFTGKQYKKHYRNDSKLIATLKDIMSSKNILFLGASLDKDRTLDVFKKIRRDGTRHYAILPCADDEMSQEARWKELTENYHIMPILYPLNEHGSVNIILKKLLELTNTTDIDNEILLIEKSNKDYEDIFIALLALQCAYETPPDKEKLQKILDEMRSVFEINRKIDVDHVIKLLTINKLIRNQPGLLFELNDKGIRKFSEFMGTQYHLLQKYLKNSITEYEGIQALLCKFMVEKLPSEIRFINLEKIIDFLQKYYEKICWKSPDHKFVVPFHELEKADGYEVKCVTSNFNGDELKTNIFETYMTYFNGRYKEDNPKAVSDGSIYRFISWYKDMQRKKIVLSVTTDQGYFAFQSTCGVIRNEIEKSISNFNGNVESFMLQLPYREQTLHNSDEPQKIIEKLKRRAVKIGIETCTVIVERDEHGNICNPRIPILFRSDAVAEYPSFTMVVPSGAYQAGLLTNHSNESYYNIELKKRLNWRVSVIRELGEELFRIPSLEKYNIKELMESVQYKMCEEIVENALYFDATGLGIDLYIGSGGLLTTLILDYNTVLKILCSYDNILSGSENELDTIETEKSTSEAFIDLNDTKADDFYEGRIYMFRLDENLVEHIMADYSIEEKPKNLRPISPLNHCGNFGGFRPMIPSGVLSVLHAKDILSQKFNLEI